MSTATAYRDHDFTWSDYRAWPHLIEVYELADDAYKLRGGYTKGGKPLSPSFPDLTLDLDRVFDFPLAPGEAVKMVKEGRPPYAAGELAIPYPPCSRRE